MPPLNQSLWALLISSLTAFRGGGGAEQDPILPGRTAIKVPENYPPDLYLKGQPPKEEYNYLLVDVAPDRKTQFTLNRFRPWAAKPLERVELFGSAN